MPFYNDLPLDMGHIDSAYRLRLSLLLYWNTAFKTKEVKQKFGIINSEEYC